MKFTKKWIIPLILTATAGIAVLQSGTGAVSTDEAAKTAAGSEAPATQATERCAYQWASHDAPELTQKFSTRIQKLDPKAEVQVSLYGEDCVYADGHADFHVMESDFYVRKPVTDLINVEPLGDWMAQVMEAVLAIPREDLKGNYGFVEFWFMKSDSEPTIIRAPIQRYINEGRGKSGIELYRLFIMPIPY
jgi:hypothetical protein